MFLYLIVTVDLAREVVHMKKDQNVLPTTDVLPSTSGHTMVNITHLSALQNKNDNMETEEEGILHYYWY